MPLHRASLSMRRRRYGITAVVNATATSEIYTLSLHDALPISIKQLQRFARRELVGVDLAELVAQRIDCGLRFRLATRDRKSTRLNSSHTVISYAVFCLKQEDALLLWAASRLRRPLK